MIPIQNGIVREAAVDSLLVPQNTCQFALNLNFDRIGAIQSRNGITALGSVISAGNSVLGMTNYRNNAGTIYQLLANINGSVHAYNGSSWGSIRSGLTPTAKARFTNFVDYTFMVNGNGNQACQSYNGAGSFGSTNCTNLKKGDFIDNFRSRIWIANNTTDKLYYSDVVTTSNTITGGADYIQISPQDGENITGIFRHPRALIVAKQNHMYRIFSINATDPDPFINLGTYSQESIIESKAGFHFHHPSGFYNFIFDGFQQEISKPIIDIVNAIPRLNYPNITGWPYNDHLYWSIGDITLEGISLTNVVCRYTISTQTWTVYNYPVEIKSTSLYDDGTNLVMALGGDAGYVYTFDSGDDDAGSPINFEFYTHWMYLSELKSTSKELTEVAAIHENAQGTNLSYQIDNDSRTKWRSIGQINQDLYNIYNVNSKFTRIRFRINGSKVGDTFVFRGFEMLNILGVGEVKK